MMPKHSSEAAPGNVRWDDVVDATLVQSSVMPVVQRWRDRGRPASDVRVHVRLFGALASVAAEQALDLVVAKPATVAAVVAALGERLGEAFLARVIDESGAKQRCCRLFVAGAPIEDLRTPIDTDSIEIEMILLVAIEGG
jgi:molybdopterin converting factor small subunit